MYVLYLFGLRSIYKFYFSGIKMTMDGRIILFQEEQPNNKNYLLIYMIFSRTRASNQLILHEYFHNRGCIWYTARALLQLLYHKVFTNIYTLRMKSLTIFSGEGYLLHNYTSNFLIF